MKKMLFVASALAALSLLAPSASFAATSQIGVYTDPAGGDAAAQINVAASTPFTAYLVVTNPVNETFQDSETGPEYQRVMTSVNGFEAAVVRPTDGFFELNKTYAGDQVDVGTGNDFIVGFGTPIPVVNNAVTLVTFSWMVLDTNPKMVYMGLTTPQSLAGNMVLVDGDDVPRFAMSPVYASSGDLANPVFTINGTTVATDNESWGGVKALYR